MVYDLLSSQQLLGVKSKMTDSYEFLNRNWQMALKDKIETQTATVVATATAIFASTVPTGTKRRVVMLTISNASDATPYRVFVDREDSAGTTYREWRHRPLAASGYVQDVSPSYAEPLFNIDQGGNLQVGGSTGFDGYVEVKFYDEHTDIE